MTGTIGNPGSWIVDEARIASRHVASAVNRLGSHDLEHEPMPEVRKISVEDLREVLQKGFEDFRECRTDVAFLCLLYPAIGLCLAWIAFDRDLLPLLFPAISGFALLGPVFGVGLYEMSRRREMGLDANWADAFGVMARPRFGAILALGVLFGGVFVAWLLTASGIYSVTMGPEPPVSLAAFLRDLFTTAGGWTMSSSAWRSASSTRRWCWSSAWSPSRSCSTATSASRWRWRPRCGSRRSTRARSRSGA